MATVDPAEIAAPKTVDPAAINSPRTIDPGDIAPNVGVVPRNTGTTAPATPSPRAPSRAPARTYGQEFFRALEKNVNELTSDLNETVRAPTMLGKLWGGIKSFGSAYGTVFTPVEAGLTQVLGPAVEQMTGGYVSPEATGEWGALATGLFFDPVNILGGAAKAVRETKFMQNALEALSPATRSANAQRAADLISTTQSRGATRMDRIVNELNKYRGMLNRLPEAERIAFQDRIMQGMRQPTPELEAAAKAFRTHQDKLTEDLQAMGRKTGTNILADANDDYLGVIWKSRNKDIAQAEENMQRTHRSLRGSANFLKRKKYKTISEGLADPQFMADFELATTDPVEMMITKFAEQTKYLEGTEAAWTTKQSGLAKWVGVGKTVPPGFEEMPDRAFRGILPPAKFTAVHETGFDAGLRAGLYKLAKFLGVKIKTPLSSQDPNLAGAYGYTYARPRADVVSRFGNESVIIEHEIGHQIDSIYGLQHIMLKDKAVLDELRRLGMERAGGPSQWAAIMNSPKKAFGVYLVSPPELMANMFHAFWHSPQFFQQKAPNAYRALRKFLDSKPDLKAAVDAVKPSLTVAGDYATQEFKGAGPQFVGAWYAPTDVVRVWKRFLSTGLQHKGIYETLRTNANALNMFQLGLSAFHLTFTSIDAVVSRVAQSIESAMNGELGRAAGQLLTAPLAPVTTARKGGQLHRELMNPAGASKMFKPLERAFYAGGGRVRMPIFRAGDNSLLSGLRNGTFVNEISKAYEKSPIGTVLGLPLRIAHAALNDISYPMMEWLVPRQKLGVFTNLAEDFMRRNPTAAPEVFDREMRKIWDSVDNRLGQMVYDNRFWDRAAKDIAHIAIRSVGWNVGTVGEIGGGLGDYAKAIHALRNGDPVEFTHRMAYVIALPVVAGTIGAAIFYAYNGRGPDTMMDYYFPRTGRRTPRGDAERIIVPSYIKDVLEVNEAPIRTTFAKLNPIWGWLTEVYSNRDFYGGIIHDPNGTFDEQASQFLAYLYNQILPFSVRSYQRLGREGSDYDQQIASFFGFQAAPQWIVNPERAAAFQRRSDIAAIKKRRREEMGR